MSDVEIVNIMLGSYSRDDEENNCSKNEANLDSGSSRLQQNSNVIGEDFRSLLNTNSRENSEIVIDTTSMISEEISNQMSRKLNEIKTGLSFQIQYAISNAITEKIRPFIQNTLEVQGEEITPWWTKGPMGYAANLTMGDRRSSGLQRNSEVENAQKTWGNRPSKCFMQKDRKQVVSRQTSVDSIGSEQNRDTP